MELNSKAIEKMSFSEKKKFVYRMFLMYKKIQIMKNTQKIHSNLHKEQLPEYIEENKSTFELVLEQLDPQYSWIIQKEFSSDSANWSEEYYSKSTYYKTIHKALDQFLYFIYG